MIVIVVEKEATYYLLEDMSNPPPPPPPPPPVTTNEGASTVGTAMPPPPPPIVTFTEEEESAIQSALLSSCTILEEARCLKSEQEANLMMASSILANNGTAEVDVSNLPGGIQDAWVVLSDATSNESTVKDPIAHLQQQQQQQDNNDSRKSAMLPLGQGQLGKIATVTALSACVNRTSAVSNRIQQKQQQRDLKSALENTKRKLNTTPGNTTQAVAATTKLWLRVLDHRLKNIRSYHARHSNNDMTSKAGIFLDNTRKNTNKRARLGNPGADGYDLASSIAESLEGIREGTAFSSEEVMGKYMELQSLYESYVIPIKSIMKSNSSYGYVDFLTFLSKGESGIIEGIAESTKLKERKKYIRFLVALENYLDGFLKRIQPLLSKSEVTKAAVQDFENNWSRTGGSLGWETKPSEAVLAKQHASIGNKNEDESSCLQKNESLSTIDVSTYASANDLEQALDGETMKAELIRLGLKCGGTVADRAKRLFSTKDTPLDQLPKKLFAKKKTPIDMNTDTARKNGTPYMTPHVNVKNQRRIDIAKREVVVTSLLNQFKPILEATIRRTGRRETQTTKEREKEIEEDMHGPTIAGSDGKLITLGMDGKYDSDENSDGEDAPIYNPKGVPLGWDGKPIPYWLFKLHGLNHFYTCEICGGESYRGRKNFETHFAEAKHSYGMKILGIPNTKHFHGVTKIEDAQNLWKKLQDQLERDQFDGTNGEEYEDSHGNVLSRATYEDLARQGLL